jgi:hypothetical protein
MSTTSDPSSASQTGLSLKSWLIGSGGLLATAATILVAFITRGDATPPSPATPPPSAGQAISVQGNGNHTSNSSTSDSHDIHGPVSNSQIVGRDVNNTTNINISPDALKALTQGQARPGTKSIRPEDYIDRGVHRVSGSLNVAVVVQGAADTAPLLSAMHRALIDRDMAVVPLFREKFRRDGTAQRLFAGDAALATSLKLRDYVDSVLLAEFRFAGPAQHVQGGLYIREGVLEVHAIDPSSGEVRKVLEIREKGGGSTAEQSSENALTRLEESIENDISGWIWV